MKRENCRAILSLFSLQLVANAAPNLLYHNLFAIADVNTL